MPAPLANFSATPASGIVPLTVNFTDLSVNTATSWAWDFENNGSTDSTSQNPTNTYNLAGVYTVKLVATNSSGTDTETKVSYITVSSPAATSYYPLSTGTQARADDYNYIQGIINDVMGLNPNGYGVPWLYSSPVNTGTRLTAKQWNDLKLDVNTAYLHITNTETATFSFITSTDVASVPGYDVSTATLSVARHNLLAEAADYILTNRYTCHPLQYFADESGNISRIGGVSSRTETWGLGPDIEIYHTVHAVFATVDSIRYFFNAGGVFSWLPGWTQEARSDIDQAWQGFINYWLTNLNYEYNRTDFLNTDTKTTNYSSGTLQMSVVAGKTTSGTFANREIVFTATYRNTDIGSLVVVPTTGLWDYQLP